MTEEDKRMLDTLDEKIREKFDPEPVQLATLRTQLQEAIGDSEMIDAYKLKLLYSMTFNLPTETIEVQQLHEVQHNHDKKFADLKNLIEKNKEENQRDHKMLKYGLIGLAVASGILGIVESQVIDWILRIFGLGG